MDGLWMGASLAVLIMTAAPALADSQSNGESADILRDVDTIVVRADLQAKVAEVGPLGKLSILTTPYSINSVTADTIELRQTRTLIELQKTDPSAQFLFNGFGAPIVAIRGFTSEVRLEGTRSQVSSQFPLEFVDRIDIIKGASSSLYGFAPPGGVVDYALKRPEPNAFLNATASYRSDTDLLGRVDANVPLTSTLGVRVNGLYEGGETYLDGDRQNRVALAGAVDWRPVDNLLIRGDFTWQRNAPKSGGATTVFPLPGVALPEPINPRRRYLQSWERFRINVYAYGLRSDWTFAPDWTLALRARGYTQPRTYYSSGGLALLPGNALSNSIYAFNDGQNSYSQQAKLTGKVSTGVLIHNLTLSADRQYDPSFSGTGFTFLSIDTGTIANPLDVSRPANFQLPDDPRYRTNRTIQKSGTVADRIEFGPWTALLAVRYIDFSLRNFTPTGALTSDNSVKKWTPTVGLSRRLGDHFSVYASYAQGLEPGAIPPISPTNPVPRPLAPVGSDQFEGGTKAEFGQLTATAAIFHLRRDYQASTFLSDGVTPAFIDDGKQVHNGAEITVSGLVAPGWNVIAGATYLNAKIKNASGFAINGQTPVGVAKFQSTLFVEHQLSDELFANVSVFHASGREIDVINDRRIGGFTTIDAGLRYVGTIGTQRFSLNANVENVFNERYWGGVYFGFLSLGTPRQFKLTASIGF